MNLTSRLPNNLMILRKKNLKELVTERKNSFAGIAAVVNVAYAMALAVPISMSVATANQANKPVSTAELALNQKKSVIALVDGGNAIKPGESQVQREEREAREKAEAEARAQAAAAASKKTVKVSTRTYNDPSNFDGIYQRAQAAYGVDWRILKAVHYVETGCSGSTTKANPSGAAGPMQFIASTWRAYGVDGNGDGVADRYNVEDAIFAAARYLSACGYPNVKAALWGYNPSSAYYYKVMDVAHSLGYNG